MDAWKEAKKIMVQAILRNQGMDGDRPEPDDHDPTGWIPAPVETAQVGAWEDMGQALHAIECAGFEIVRRGKMEYTMTHDQLAQAIRDTQDLLCRTVCDLEAFGMFSNHLHHLLKCQAARAEMMIIAPDQDNE